MAESPRGAAGPGLGPFSRNGQQYTGNAVGGDLGACPGTSAATPPAQAERPQDRERRIRRAELLRRFSLLCRQATDLQVVRALDLEDHYQAYRLVHDCYVERGYIKPCPRGLRVRPFEAVPEMATFVAKDRGRVIAVAGTLTDSPDLGLPSDAAFPQELAALRREGRRLCEVTNLAVDPGHRNTPAFGELTRCCLAHAIATGSDDMFVAISPEHAPFFEGVLPFDPWGDRRTYGTEVTDVVEGKRLDLLRAEGRCIQTDAMVGRWAFLHDYYFARNPYWERVGPWAAQAARVHSDVELLHELFVARSDLFLHCSAEELEAIRSRWGAETYRQVMRRAGRECPDEAQAPDRQDQEDVAA